VVIRPGSDPDDVAQRFERTVVDLTGAVGTAMVATGFDTRAVPGLSLSFNLPIRTALTSPSPPAGKLLDAARQLDKVGHRAPVSGYEPGRRPCSNGEVEHQAERLSGYL
jgi:hypothetical protein